MCKRITAFLVVLTCSILVAQPVRVTTTPIYLEAAGCQNATATLFWDTPTSNPAVAACNTGTNIQKGSADFADGSNLSMQRTFLLPSRWTSPIDVTFVWLANATSGNVVWQISWVCSSVTATDDPAFGAASTVTSPSNSVANTLIFSTVSITPTDCGGGKVAHFKIARDSGHASDTMAATAKLLGTELVFRRLQ